jgi:xanthine dehydrogenase accessory factor
MILAQLSKCMQKKEQAVLATVIHKEGSTYRQVGAKSLILTDGATYGVLSGGCVEEDLFEHAKTVVHTGMSQTLTYDLRHGDDLPWGLGVGCNGSLTIWLSLFDPINRPNQAKQTLNLFTKFDENPDPFTSMSVISSSNHDFLVPGMQLDMDSTHPLENDYSLQKLYNEHLRSRKQSNLYHHEFLMKGKEIKATVFLETVSPKPRVTIFGAGPDAVPLVKQMKCLNWHVTVVDHRPDFGNSKNFPDADHIDLVKPGSFPKDLPINKNTYSIVMSHHYEQDLTYLEGLLNQPTTYIGMLGPKKRTKSLLDDLQKKAVFIPKGTYEKIYSPVGLDIGSETPEEIALSIVSEMMCHRRNCSGQPLRNKSSCIHTPRSEERAAGST